MKNTTGLDEYHTLGPRLGHCKVVAHAVISMDRMYNGRAATMNIVASGSLMRWIALAFLQSLQNIAFPEAPRRLDTITCDGNYYGIS